MIEILCDDSTKLQGGVWYLVIMITTEADNDKRLTWVLNQWEIVWTISFIVFSCKNVKLSFLFVALYLALYAQY